MIDKLTTDINGVETDLKTASKKRKTAKREAKEIVG
jgi:hypothetical protein